MNFTSRMLLSAMTVGLFGSGCWIIIMPHLFFQYCVVFLSPLLVGGALFAVTENDEPDTNLSQKIQKMKEETAVEDKKKEILQELSEPLTKLKEYSEDINQPNIFRKFYRICSIGEKINQYGFNNGCMDKLYVWNKVYVDKVAYLVYEYNTIVKIPDPSTCVIRKIDEFGSLANEIMDKFQKQYDDLLSGKIEGFDIDMTLVRQLHDT